MFENPAKDALKDVIAWHRGGVKSPNKAYIRSDEVSVEEIPAARFQWENNTKKEASANKLNQTRNQSYLAWRRGQLRFEGRNSTFFEYGKFFFEDNLFFEDAEAGEVRAATCKELAACAAYVAIQKKNVSASHAWIAMIGNPINHYFCILSQSKPSWYKVPEMRSLGADSGAYIIDPWLNFACPAEDYATKSNGKFQIWQGINKRIHWKGDNSGFLDPGWYAPVGFYEDAFKTAIIEYFTTSQTVPLVTPTDATS